MSAGREIVCNRFVFRRQRVRREERSRRTSRPSCLYLRGRDRQRWTRDRASAQGALSGKTAVGPRAFRSLLDDRVRRLGGGGKLHARRVAVPAADHRSLRRVHGDPQYRDGAQGCPIRRQQAARAEPDPGVPALSREGDGPGPQGGDANARLLQDQSHSGRDRRSAGLLPQGRLLDGGTSVQGDAIPHRFPPRHLSAAPS